MKSRNKSTILHLATRINTKVYRSYSQGLAANSAEPTSIGVRWKEWRDQFYFYPAAADIKDKKQRRTPLLHLSGLTVQKVFEGLSDTGDDFNTAEKKLHEHFSPKKNIRFHERYRFKQTKQQQRESLDPFAFWQKIVNLRMVMMPQPTKF